MKTVDENSSVVINIYYSVLSDSNLSNVLRKDYSVTIQMNTVNKVHCCSAIRHAYI